MTLMETLMRLFKCLGLGCRTGVARYSSLGGAGWPH
jgi:hypothetical protein